MLGKKISEVQAAREAVEALLKGMSGRWVCPWCFTAFKTKRRFWFGPHYITCKADGLRRLITLPRPVAPIESKPNPKGKRRG